MYNHLHTVPACDGRTDGQTDILPQHSPCYAMRRAVKTCVGVYMCRVFVKVHFEFVVVVYAGIFASYNSNI